MRRTSGQLLATAGVIMVLGASGGVASASSAPAGHLARAAAPAAASAQLAKPAPPAHVINLRQTYKKTLPKTRVGKISGIVYARGEAPKRAAAAASSAAACAEPNCPLTYHGGAVQHSPHVYLLLWGPNWTSDPAQQASYSYLWNFYAGLGVQPQDTWSRITTAYGDGSGPPSFYGSVFMGAWQDASTPWAGVGDVQLAAEANSFALQVGATSADDQVVIATQAGTCPQGFACPGANGNYCAWHADSLGLWGVPFINLPYQLDAGSSCGENYVRGMYDGFSIVGGHEYAETVTDPYISAWYEPDASTGEIGDKCAWTGLGSVALSTGTFAMQSLFSNVAYAVTGRGCTLAWPDNVTLANPGNQASTVHTNVSLQLQASSSAGYPLTFGASGLPAGLSINPATGLISGSPTTSGTYSVAVSAADQTTASSGVTLTWTVNGSGDVVTVTDPGAQEGTTMTRQSLQMKATSSGGFPLSYSATGLPSGLTIGAGTGLISGIANRAGTYTVRVTATDSAGSAGQATFTWTIDTVPICGARIQLCY